MGDLSNFVFSKLPTEEEVGKASTLAKWILGSIHDLKTRLKLGPVSIPSNSTAPGSQIEEDVKTIESYVALINGVLSNVVKKDSDPSAQHYPWGTNLRGVQVKWNCHKGELLAKLSVCKTKSALDHNITASTKDGISTCPSTVTALGGPEALGSNGYDLPDIFDEDFATKIRIEPIENEDRAFYVEWTDLYYAVRVVWRVTRCVAQNSDHHEGKLFFGLTFRWQPGYDDYWVNKREHLHPTAATPPTACRSAAHYFVYLPSVNRRSPADRYNEVVSHLRDGFCLNLGPDTRKRLAFAMVMLPWPEQVELEDNRRERRRRTRRRT